MRPLLDINVLLDVAVQRPEALSSAWLLGLCGRQHEGWLAWHSIATLAYLIERQQSNIVSREFIGGLLSWAEVSGTGRADALAALDLPMKDFEDALQVAAAMACGAQFVITRNERDFRGSPVPALNASAFLRKFPVPCVGWRAGPRWLAGFLPHEIFRPRVISRNSSWIVTSRAPGSTRIVSPAVTLPVCSTSR